MERRGYSLKKTLTHMHVRLLLNPSKKRLLLNLILHDILASNATADIMQRSPRNDESADVMCV
jgi:hypothetical protein